MQKDHVLISSLYLREASCGVGKMFLPLQHKCGLYNPSSLLPIPIHVQAAVKKEAMESSLDEQMKDKEAVEAENAAQACLIQQHEAAVSIPS